MSDITQRPALPGAGQPTTPPFKEGTKTQLETARDIVSVLQETVSLPAPQSFDDASYRLGGLRALAKFLVQTLGVALVLASVGCMGIRHEHINADGTKDIGKFSAFVYKIDVDKLKASTQWKDYKRTLGAEKASIESETEKLNALLATAVAAAVKAAKTP